MRRKRMHAFFSFFFVSSYIIYKMGHLIWIILIEYIENNQCKISQTQRKERKFFVASDLCQNSSSKGIKSFISQLEGNI